MEPATGAYVRSGPAREDMRSLELTTTVVSPDDSERKDAMQLRSRLQLMGLVRWLALPFDRVFPDPPPTPGLRLREAQEPTKAEAVTPVHERCGLFAFDAVK